QPHPVHRGDGPYLGEERERVVADGRFEFPPRLECLGHVHRLPAFSRPAVLRPPTPGYGVRVPRPVPPSGAPPGSTVGCGAMELRVFTEPQQGATYDE